MSLSSANFPSVPASTAEAIIKPWLEIIKREECGIVSFPPRGGAYRRIEQLLDWPQLRKKYLGKNYGKYRLIDYSAFGQFDISLTSLTNRLLNALLVSSSDPIQTPQAFISCLHPALAKSQSITFLIYDVDEWFAHSRLDLMVFLSKVSQLEPKIQFLLFCELDVTSPSILKLNLGTTTLTQNIITVPLYSRSDIEYFIHELERFWHVSIPQKNIDHILDLVGCHIWLVKEAARIFLNENRPPKSLLNQPTMRFKLEAIWQQINFEEQQLLAKLASGKPISKFNNPTSVYYLESIGFIATRDNRFYITLPILKEFINQKVLQSNFEISSVNEIYLDGKIISHRFGKLEKQALVYLLQQTGGLVSRDELGSSLWPESETSYSDWALDRLMSRLRGKVYSLGVDPDRLKTIKKAGWIWQ
jgi:DNA-binding winged helix-turn-helix (wHTH) protein